jgi:hypothetical protein
MTADKTILLVEQPAERYVYPARPAPRQRGQYGGVVRDSQSHLSGLAANQPLTEG